MGRFGRAVRARLYGFEHAYAIMIGCQAAEAAEGRIMVGVTRVVGVVVRAARIGLPQLDHGVVHRNAIAIQNAADQRHAFALRAWASQAAGRFVHREAEMKERSDGLRRRHFHLNPRKE